MSKRKTTAEQLEKRRFWNEHIEAWKNSGLRQSEYCRRHQLKNHRFVYWKKKFARSKDTSVSLVEVSLPKIFQRPVQYRPTALKVAVGDKYKVEVEPGFDPLTFKQVIHTLGQL